MKRPKATPLPDLLEVANHQVPFGANPLSVTSLLHTTLIRGLKRIPDSAEKHRAMCQMISELTDLLGTGADDLIVVRHPVDDAHSKAKEPNPRNEPGLAVPEKPHR